MKHYLLFLFTIFSCIAQAQNTDTAASGFGMAINTDFNNQTVATELSPTALYYNGKHQLELGVGFNPFSRKSQHIISGRFNYKYFPNGRAHKFNMYFNLSSYYTQQQKKTFYPTTHQYVFLSGGYGFQVSVYKGLNLGTNMNLGTFTEKIQSTNPYITQLGSKKLFDNFGGNISFQVHLGYRF